MKPFQKGFTLIELMIVVAIIAILTTIALPAYQNHTVRARVTEALVSVEPAKLNVLEVLASGNPNASTDGYGQGYTSPEASRNLQRVDIDAVTGMITVTTTANAGGGTLTLMPYTGTALPGTPLPPGKGVFTPPEQPAKWRCAAQGTTNLATGQQAGSLAARFAPAECK